MQETIDYSSIAPEVVKPLYEAGKALHASTLEPSLRSLVELRASQINGCGLCLAMHMREARDRGLSWDQIVGLPAWREASWYSPRERAALEWTEALTKLSEGHPPADMLARVREHFTEKELAYLMLAITTINAWNRFNVAFARPSEEGERIYDRLNARV